MAEGGDVVSKNEHFEFVVPEQEMTLVLKMMTEGELTDFSMRYAAKAKAFQSLKAKLALLESTPAAELPEDYAKRLETQTLQQMRLSLELYRLITTTLRSRIVKAIGKDANLDVSSDEGWARIFDKSKDAGMDNITSMAQQFVQAHSPEQAILKNSLRA